MFLSYLSKLPLCCGIFLQLNNELIVLGIIFQIAKYFLYCQIDVQSSRSEMDAHIPSNQTKLNKMVNFISTRIMSLYMYFRTADSTAWVFNQSGSRGSQLHNFANCKIASSIEL